MMEEDIRWIQRFKNYKKAFDSLTADVELATERELTDIEKRGLIQAFEYTYDLAWNVIKDFYQAAGEMIEKWYYELENKFTDKKCHEIIIIPNHFHCIIENGLIMDVVRTDDVVGTGVVVKKDDVVKKGAPTWAPFFTWPPKMQYHNR